MKNELINANKYQITDMELTNALKNYNNKAVIKTIIREDSKTDKLSINMIEINNSGKGRRAKVLLKNKETINQRQKKYHRSATKWFFSIEDISNALNKSLRKVGEK